MKRSEQTRLITNNEWLHAQYQFWITTHTKLSFADYISEKLNPTDKAAKGKKVETHH